jgi:hypothetical protein
MINKRKLIIIFIIAGLFVVGFGITFLILRDNNSRKITFNECEKAGGEAWLVDLSHPDICPECGGQQMNADEKVIGSLSISCTECLQNNFPYPDKCPDGKEKIGEITDAAIWFQCCK